MLTVPANRVRIKLNPSGFRVRGKRLFKTWRWGWLARGADGLEGEGRERGMLLTGPGHRMQQPQ